MKNKERPRDNPTLCILPENKAMGDLGALPVLVGLEPGLDQQSVDDPEH